MAQVYHVISSYRLLAAYQAAVARLVASAADAVRRRSERSLVASIDDVRDSERRSGRGRQSASRHQAGSVFDARYRGLSAHAALIDAAICRQQPCARRHWHPGTLDGVTISARVFGEFLN